MNFWDLMIYIAFVFIIAWLLWKATGQDESFDL